VVSASGADVRLTNMWVEVLQTTTGGAAPTFNALMIAP